MGELRDHPLMLTLRDTISGDGFLAGITLSGRALMRKEDDGKWWMYGVRPAGLAESGDTPEETFLRFRGRYKEILFDLAEENHSFNGFKEEVERFFYEADADNEDELQWQKALSAIRGGCVASPEPFSKLPRESPESKPTQITVERLDAVGRRFTPSDNVKDTCSLPLAMVA
jgi:predicted RNase H-like HicB family nuclease